MGAREPLGLDRRLGSDFGRPVIRDGIEEFIEEVFSNTLDLRECYRYLHAMYARQREQGEIISMFGNVLLNAATDVDGVAGAGFCLS